MISRPRQRRFTVEEYHRMGETGILVEDEPVELIHGAIIVSEPIGARHAGTVNRITRLFVSQLGDRAVVQVQNPIELAQERSEPEPDVALLRPRTDFYATAHPVAADVFLLVEVADSSLLLDRRVKIPLYARAGVREVWLMDLTQDRVAVYRAVRGARYRERSVVEHGQRLAPGAFPELTLTVEDLIGPRDR
ncbi:MAG: Uma2 family endonuclease [Candidatus Rokuibacteriota bacterium]